MGMRVGELYLGAFLVWILHERTRIYPLFLF